MKGGNGFLSINKSLQKIRKNYNKEQIYLYITHKKFFKVKVDQCE